MVLCILRHRSCQIGSKSQESLKHTIHRSDSDFENEVPNNLPNKRTAFAYVPFTFGIPYKPRNTARGTHLKLYGHQPEVEKLERDPDLPVRYARRRPLLLEGLADELWSALEGEERAEEGGDESRREEELHTEDRKCVETAFMAGKVGVSCLV